MAFRYVYHGGFEGFLCAVLEAARDGEEPAEVVSAGRCGQGCLLFPTRVVEADASAADAAAEMFRSSLAAGSFRRAALAFLSEEAGVETDICRYLLRGLEEGAGIDSRHADPVVRRVQRAARAVGMESHRLKGLLRFRKLPPGTLYAPMRPRHDVLCLLAPHFTRRMKGADLLIHDLGRGIAFLRNGRETALLELPRHRFEQGAEEPVLQELWREYFAAVAVPERLNPRLQAGNMPLRYWRWLLERPGESALPRG